MQQFAVASVYPRSIAWIIRPSDPDEWDRFEQIIKYNCAMIGGYFNVMVPLSDQDEVPEKYQQFLINFDPDLVVLAPGMESIKPASLLGQICPFAFIPWDCVSQIATYKPDGPRTKSGINATLRELRESQIDEDLSTEYMVAVAKKECPDTSRLALVACGDIESGEDSLGRLDKIHLDHGIQVRGLGYRGSFLSNLLKEGYETKDLWWRIEGARKFTPSPDRYKLADMIDEEYQFPLFDSIEILDTCCRMQKDLAQIESFVNSTKSYSKGKFFAQKFPFDMVILVSDNFGLEEAIHFWNLRANEIYVAWMSFSELETNINYVLDWLEGNIFILGGGYGHIVPSDLYLVFSSTDNDIYRLQHLFETTRYQKGDDALWGIKTYDKIIFYNYLKHDIKREYVIVAQDSSKSAFIPKMPHDTLGGMFTVTLELDGLMLPQKHDLVNLISSRKFSWHMSRFRITKDHFLRVQANSELPIEFNRPSPEQIIETLFTLAGFSRIERSSNAKYHTDFIKRAGSLEEAARYLATYPYHEFFELLFGQ